MPFKSFIVPIRNSVEAEEELNAFLLSHTVLSVEQRWVDRGPNSFWSYCVDYLDPATTGGKASRPSSLRGRIDYREVLNDEDFALFSRLRDLRKEIAQAEGVPVYTVFNNEQLAKMIQNKARTTSDLEAIGGVRDARIEKYGTRFLDFLTQHWGTTDEADSKPV